MDRDMRIAAILAVVVGTLVLTLPISAQVPPPRYQAVQDCSSRMLPFLTAEGTVLSQTSDAEGKLAPNRHDQAAIRLLATYAGEIQSFDQSIQQTSCDNLAADVRAVQHYASGLAVQSIRQTLLAAQDGDVADNDPDFLALLARSTGEFSQGTHLATQANVLVAQLNTILKSVPSLPMTDQVRSYLPTLPNDTTVQPATWPAPAPLATAQCGHGQFSYAQTGGNICVGHNGVLVSVAQAGNASAIAASELQFRQPDGAPPGCISVSGGMCVTPCADGQWSSIRGVCGGNGGAAAARLVSGNAGVEQAGVTSSGTVGSTASGGAPASP
jgi:hypothetical protein